MFSVKATYRGETRRFSFESTSFPTYQELYNQLYRVFPIHNAYYLSRLIFSSNTKLPSSRILIGKEAHSAEEYDQHVAPYQGHFWPNAVLRFSVHDENPHKAPSSGLLNESRSSFLNADDSAGTAASANVSALSETSTATVVPGAMAQDQFKRFTERKLVVERLREKIGNRPKPEVADLMLADHAESSIRSSRHSGRTPWDIIRDLEKPSRPLPVAPDVREENMFSAKNTAPPQSVTVNDSPSLGGHSARSRLPAFLESRPRSFVSMSTGQNVPTSFNTASPLLVPPPPIIYSATSQSSCFADVRMASPKESHASLSSAQTAHDPLPTQSVNTQSFRKDLEEIKEMLVDMRGELKKAVSVSSSSFAPPPIPHMSDVGAAYATGPLSFIPPSKPPHSSYSPSYIVPPPPPSFTGKDMRKTAEAMRSATRETLDRLTSHSKAMMQLHERITCDGCKAKGIMGVRFKCLQCADYDLCTACMSSPSIRQKHDAVHSFWPIDTPGDRDSYHAARTVLETSKVPASQKFVHHYITCDICNASGFSGVRFKCLECEDYDVCEKCMWTAGAMAAHPPHAFFPIEDPANFAAYGRARQQRTALTKKVLTNRSVEGAFSKSHVGINCDACKRKPLSGVRFKCLQCPDYDLCRSCLSNPSVLELHNVNHKFWPVNEPNDLTVYYQVQSRLSDLQTPVHDCITCDGCDRTIVGVRHKCLDCDNYDFCTECLSDPQQRQLHSLAHSFFPIVTPDDKSIYDRVRAESVILPSIRLDPPANDPRANDAQEEAPQVHDNIVCDYCSNTIVGIRFKCLDCADFDLCQDCVNIGAREAHAPFHSFFEIERPGVFVHTVFSGDGERTPSVGRNDTVQIAEDASVTAPRSNVEAVVHNATCNLCDSRIRGDRYKCLNCPDFDTCMSCFAITSEHHPGHGFVKVVTPDVLMIRNALGHDVAHPASCNNCDSLIHGTRYKCMHPSCHDYDLCQDCEAHPFPVHPDTHPMLKIKNIYTPIPVLGPATSSQTAASVQTSVPVAMDIEEESIGSIRELRRVYRAADEFGHSASSMDSRMLPIRNISSAAPTNEPMTTVENARPGAQFSDSRFPRQIDDYRFNEDTHRVFRDIASEDPANLSRNVQTGPESSMDARLASLLRDVPITYDTGDDEESVRNARRAYGAMDVDRTAGGSTKVGSDGVQDMRTKLNNEEVATETLLHTLEKSEKVRDISTPTGIRDVSMSPPTEDAAATHSTENATAMVSPPHVPMNVDDPRGVRQAYRSLFSTDPAAQFPSDVARQSQAVVEEMREVRRQYRNLSTINTVDNGVFQTLQDSTTRGDRPFVDHLSSSEATPAEPDSPTLAISSIPPLIPSAWVPPPSWFVDTPPSPIIVPTMLATEFTPPYQPRPVSPVFESSVTEQTVVPVASDNSFTVKSPISSSLRTTAPAARPLSPEHSGTGKSGSDRAVDDAITSAPGDLTTPSEAAEPKAIANLTSIPRLGPVQNAEWKELWPELTTMLKHLLQPPVSETSASTSMPGAIHPEEESKQAERKGVSPSDQEFHTAVEESPLAKEALLTRPEGSSVIPPVPDAFSLRHYLSSLAPAPSYVATYLSDNNIADGTIFPPGAEFVKSWRMRNDGDIAWPESTTLSFVAGDKIAQNDTVSSVKVGSVAPGSEVEVVGPEMKAPDAPGKYVSYWRLHDGQTSYFGHSVWADISVAEMNHPVTSSSGEDSLASSSVIMPRSLETDAAAVNGPASVSSVTVLSSPPSDDGSFESTISLINAPSSPSIGEDEAIYQDSRSNVFGDRPRDIEYVVLYDTSSDEE